MKLRPVRFEDESSVHYNLELETTGRNRFCYTLIVRFRGHYRPGSAGSSDAHFMHGICGMAVAMWRPAALVVDLSELRYEWGDEMDLLLSPGLHGTRSAVVVGPGCSSAIATLLFGMNTQRRATDAEFIFDSVQAAWDAVRHRG